MPWKNGPALVALFMTLLGAAANYASKVLSGELFSWRILCLQVIVSLFAGSVVMMIALHYGWSTEFTGGACGMAGWTGATLIRALEIRFLKKAKGATHEDKL